MASNKINYQNLSLGKDVLYYIGQGIFLITGVVYFLGYLKYYLILDILNLKASVGDIFSPSALLISGLAALITILFFPVALFVIKIMADYARKNITLRLKKLTKKYNIIMNLDKYIKSKFLKNALYDYTLKTLYSVYQAIFYFMVIVFVFFLYENMPFDFILIPRQDDNRIIRFFLLYIVLFYPICSIAESKKTRKYKKYFLYILLIASWTLISLLTFYSNFSNSIENDKQYSNFNQDSGMHCIIYTENEISEYSEKSEDEFKTEGILLSINKGNYFVYCIKKDTHIEGKLVMIPENKVLLTEYYERTGFGGNSNGGGASETF